MQTQVCITIDTEFSIAGAFANPTLQPVSEPFVWCNVDGRSEGLGFLLSCFKQFGITATFFVEALQRHYFQNDPMKPIVHRIRDDDHEVQLHVHPCWSIFQYSDWRERVRLQARQDDFVGRSEDESLALIRDGMAVFNDWGLPAPQVFRSGSLQHDDALYRALARSGIPYSSNIGLAVFDSADPRYALYSGRHSRHGVTECPVTTFCDWDFAGRKHLKTLTISGTSYSETRTLLEQAHAKDIELVVILTHPFEYIQSRDIGLAHSRRHGVNQQRMTKLCKFLNDHPNRFSTVGMSEAASRPMPALSDQNLILNGSLGQALGRMAMQVSYDRLGQLALACTRRVEK